MWFLFKSKLSLSSYLLILNSNLSSYSLSFFSYSANANLSSSSLILVFASARSIYFINSSISTFYRFTLCTVSLYCSRYLFEFSYSFINSLRYDYKSISFFFNCNSISFIFSFYSAVVLFKS